MNDRGEDSIFQNDSKVVFEGVRFNVNECQYADRNGGLHLYQAVKHPGAAVVLPLLDNGCIVMIKNYRFAIGKNLWELPAGLLEPNEEPKVTALRELQEETGYHAGNIKELTSFYTTAGMSTELIHGFIAWDLALHEQHLESTEHIEVHVLAKQEILELLRNNQIQDAKTALMLLNYFQFQN